jgi:hypothetical protein
VPARYTLYKLGLTGLSQKYQCENKQHQSFHRISSQKQAINKRSLIDLKKSYQQVASIGVIR